MTVTDWNPAVQKAASAAVDAMFRPSVTDDQNQQNGTTGNMAAGVMTGHRGQVRMAERFTVEHADSLRYVHGLGWHQWDKRRWQRDEERGEVGAALATIKRALVEVSGLDKGEARDDLYQDVRRSETASGIDGMLRIASALPPLSTSAKALDADPYLFNTPAGTLDLRTGEVRTCDRRDLITKVSDGSAIQQDGPDWQPFIKRILPKEEVRAFVQRLFGYAMLGKVTEHVMPIFTGAGANGKGTLRDAVMFAFGDYAIEVDPALLMEQKHERHGTFKMQLRGERLVFVSETEKGRRFAEATMKRLVGGDPIQANLMHRDPITFDPSHTLIMLTNHLPQVSGDDPAVWRRVLVVPFDVVIPPEERDPGLPDRLRLAADEVMAWVHQGWLDYQEQGLNPPQAVMVRTEAYQAASDALGRFIEERAIPSPAAHVRASELFSAWTKWCMDNREEPGAMVQFAESMERRGYAKKRNKQGFVYLGLMLLENEP